VAQSENQKSEGRKKGRKEGEGETERGKQGVECSGPFCIEWTVEDRSLSSGGRQGAEDTAEKSNKADAVRRRGDPTNTTTRCARGGCLSSCVWCVCTCVFALLSLSAFFLFFLCLAFSLPLGTALLLLSSSSATSSSSTSSSTSSSSSSLLPLPPRALPPSDLMFAPPSGINHRPGTVPGLALAHPQEQGQGQLQHLHLLHASSSSAASRIVRPKRKISSKPIRASTEKSSSRSHLPSQESPFVRNRNYAIDTTGGGDGVGGQSNNLMMNHSRQRVPSSMSTLSAFGSHNARSSRAQDRTQQDHSLPFRGQGRSLQQESNKEYQPHYLYNQDLRIHQQGSSRDRLERENLSRQQEHHRPQQSVDHRQHQQSPRSDPLTIRDILDRKELRDQISEMRRSINSNPDDPRRGLSPRQEFDPRLSPEVMAQHERLRKASEVNRAGSAFWNPSQRVGPSSFNTRRPAQEGSVVTDLSMDHSLLEQQFREKLDAAIQVQTRSKHSRLACNLQEGIIFFFFFFVLTQNDRTIS